MASDTRAQLMQQLMQAFMQRRPDRGGGPPGASGAPGGGRSGFVPMDRPNRVKPPEEASGPSGAPPPGGPPGRERRKGVPFTAGKNPAFDNRFGGGGLGPPGRQGPGGGRPGAPNAAGMMRRPLGAGGPGGGTPPYGLGRGRR